MPPWVYQKRPEERFDDTLWGDSNTTQARAQEQVEAAESDLGKGTGDADDLDDPPAKDEVPLHTRLTEFAGAVDSPSMRRTMSSKTPETAPARRADWYRKRWYSIDPNADSRQVDLSQAAIPLYVAMVVLFQRRVQATREGVGTWWTFSSTSTSTWTSLNFHTGHADPDDVELADFTSREAIATTAATRRLSRPTSSRACPSTSSA